MQRKPKCWEVTLHFHDPGLAKGTYDATPLDEAGIWKVTMKEAEH
jgi:hypothetical protein